MDADINSSTLAQRKRDGPITHRSLDRNQQVLTNALQLTFFLGVWAGWVVVRLFGTTDLPAPFLLGRGAVVRPGGVGGVPCGATQAQAAAAVCMGGVGQVDRCSQFGLVVRTPLSHGGDHRFNPGN